MDWQEVGEQVYEFLRQKRDASIQKSIALDSEIGPSTLFGALVQASRGRTKPLREWLLSDKEFGLEAEDRKFLAES